MLGFTNTLPELDDSRLPLPEAALQALIGESTLDYYRRLYKSIT